VTEWGNVVPFTKKINPLEKSEGRVVLLTFAFCFAFAMMVFFYNTD